MPSGKTAQNPSANNWNSLLIEINERCLQRRLSAGQRAEGAPPIDTYVEHSDGNGVRIVATPEYRDWFIRTYRAQRDEVSVSQTGSRAQTQEPGTGRRGRPNAVLLNEF